MYEHNATATDQKKSLKDEFEDLQKRFDEVLRVTSRHEETIKFLQYKIDMMGKQMIGAVKEMSEHIEYIEDVTRENERIEQMDFEQTKTIRKENLDDSYNIHCDAQFKEIMEMQRDIAADVEDNLVSIESGLKKQKVEETLGNLTKLKSKIKSNEKEMKQKLEKDIRYLEYYKDEQEAVFRCIDENGDSYSDDDEDWKPKMDEMYEFLYKMVENIESLPRNNFKKGAEIEIKKMIEIAAEMRNDRDTEIDVKF